MAELRDVGGWSFRHYETDPDVIELMAGVRVWPDGSTDTLGIRDETDARAVRTNPHGELVCRHEGDMAAMLDALLMVPSPAELLAPQMVIPGCRPCV